MNDELDKILLVQMPEARRAVGDLDLTQAELEVLQEFDRHFEVVLSGLTHESPKRVDPGAAIKALIKANEAAKKLDSMRPHSEGDEPQIAWLSATFDGFWTDVSHSMGISGGLLITWESLMGKSPAMLLVERFLESWFLKN
jgi:hypothetical protein